MLVCLVLGGLECIATEVGDLLIGWMCLRVELQISVTAKGFALFRTSNLAFNQFAV